MQLRRFFFQPLQLHLEVAHLDHALRPDSPTDAAHVRELCARNDLAAQFWLQSYGFPAGTEYEIADAIKIALEEGMTDLAMWSYRCCEPISKLWPADIDRTWAVVLEALAEARHTHE